MVIVHLIFVLLFECVMCCLVLACLLYAVLLLESELGGGRGCVKHGHPHRTCASRARWSHRGFIAEPPRRNRLCKVLRASLAGSFEPTVLGPTAVELSDLARRAAVVRPRVVEPSQHRRVARPLVCDVSRRRESEG